MRFTQRVLQSVGGGGSSTGTGATVIVGATGGVGSAIARRLVQHGRPVHLIARNASLLQQLSSDLNGASYTTADVLDESAIKRAVAEAADKHGGLQSLAYCVGSIPLGAFSTAKTATFTDAFALNVLGAVHALQAAHPHLLRTSQQAAAAAAASAPASAGTSSALLFSSVAATTGFSNHAAISMAKAALEALTRSLAAEWSPHVRINAIAPSLTQSKIASRFFSNPKLLDTIADSHPLRRCGHPDDLAPLACMLLSPRDSAWITGQVFHVDGGRSSVQVEPRTSASASAPAKK